MIVPISSRRIQEKFFHFSIKHTEIGIKSSNYQVKGDHLVQRVVSGTGHDSEHTWNFAPVPLSSSFMMIAFQISIGEKSHFQ